MVVLIETMSFENSLDHWTEVIFLCLVFSSAPEATDKIFASFIGETVGSFDITDNTVDEFTANGSTTTFTLSKTVSSSNDLLVTLDGVTQYPNTQSATRAYNVVENVLTFTSAPAAGVIIQARRQISSAYLTDMLIGVFSLKSPKA